jgi:hypothetical protein
MCSGGGLGICVACVSMHGEGERGIWPVGRADSMVMERNREETDLRED